MSDEAVPRFPTARYFRRAALFGAVAGLAGAYLTAMGIVDRFEVRNVITGVIGLGALSPALVMLAASYAAGRAPRTWGFQRPPGWLPLAGAAVAGSLGGIVLAAFVLLAGPLRIANILGNVTPSAIEILTFGLELPLGAAVVLAEGIVLGVIAGALLQLPRRARQPLVIAAFSVLVFSLVEPLLSIALLQLGLRGIESQLYRSHGLNPPAALAIFAVVLGIAALVAFGGRRVERRFAALPAPQRRGISFVGVAVVAIILVLLPQIIGSFMSEVAGTVGLYLLMGLGLNIVVGYAGLLDLGYVAFWAVGAYATAMLTSSASSLGWELNFWVALPIVMLVAATIGILIGAPVLRLRGDYLAIVTLGFGEIVRILFLSDWLRPIFGGAQGILEIPAPELAGIRFREPQNLYYPILIAVAIGAFVAWSLANSRVGRAWNAMREDEDVAEATGVNTTRYKLLAFAIGAVFGCVAGAFLAAKLGSVFPQRLDILVSITTLALIILGGMGSIRGVIIGAIVLVGLPELLREFGEYRLLIYGAVLVGMMLLRPEGLLPSATRRRELHEQEEPEEQYQERSGVDTGAPAIKTAPL